MAESTLEPLTAFIVDDDPGVARAISRELHATRYRAIGTASDAATALAAIPRVRPALVLMDLNLGGEVDGIALAVQLAAIGVDAPIVFMTGGAKPDLAPLAGDGVYAYVEKGELGDSLRAAVELVEMQHAARTRLQHVTRRYTALFEQAAVGVAELAAGSKFVAVNRRCAEILGYSVAQLCAMTVSDLVEPAARKDFRARIARATHAPVTIEVPCRRGDGARVHLRFDASPLDEPRELADHFALIVQDVTEATRNERVLRRQQRLLAESQRIGRIGSYLVELATGAIEWSDELYRLHGVERDAFEVTAASVTSLVHPDDRAGLASAIASHSASGAPTTDVRYRTVRPDGTTRELAWSGEAVHGDGGPLLVGTVRDITESVLAEAALRHSDARYRGVFHNAVGGIMCVAMDGTIVDANPAFVAILACATAEDLIGSDLRTWFWDPADARRLDFARPRPGEPIEATWRRLDGRRASVVIDGLAIEQSGERYFLGFVRDLTAERERTAREREAIEASRAKTAFLASMSHELRTPLNAVLGLSEALLERTFGELGDAQVRSLETIYASGRHLLALINDVLDIARVEAGQLPMEPELVPLREPIDESLALVQSQAQQKGQRLRTELDGPLPSVDIDKRRIKQVLINLLGNAVKFSPPGTTITLRTRRPRADAIEIAVSDQGCGIAREDHERIFEPFVTLDRSLAREHGGAGLGLTMVKRIVELHGGSVRVESALGVGSTFAVELPAPPQSIETARAARESGAPTTRRSRAPLVLLAEDNEANIITFQGYLESRGYPVRVVRDGASAVFAAAAPDVAVVLMDVQLPILDGLEAVRRIRAAERDANARTKVIIALTAYAMPGDEERCLAAGATSYLAKPVRLRQLTEHIDDLTSGAEACS